MTGPRFISDFGEPVQPLSWNNHRRRIRMLRAYNRARKNGQVMCAARTQLAYDRLKEHSDQLLIEALERDQ